MSIIFIFHSRNHVRMAAQTIIGLRTRGHDVRTFDLAKVTRDLTPREECNMLLGEASKPFTAPERLVTAGDLVVVGCDWAPVGRKWLDIMAQLRELGAVMVGLMEGCRWMQSDRYRLVDYLLAYAPIAHQAFAARARPPQLRLVGLPTLEQSLSSTGVQSAEPGEYALLNFKSTKSAYPHRGDACWIENALEACAQNDLRPLVSCHPHNMVGLPDDVPVTGSTFAEAIRRARVLISPPSTVVLEALARRIPVVVYPNGNEHLLEFAHPMGAFEVVREPEPLAAAIGRAVDPAHCICKTAHDFLEHHLSIDDRKPAWLRIADALEEILAIETSKAATPRGRLEFRPVWELKSLTGELEEDAIVCRPGEHEPGHCVYGGDHVIARDGRFRAIFDVTVAPAPSIPGEAVNADIYENRKSKTVLAERAAGLSSNSARGISLEFTAFSEQCVEFRLYWYGGHRVDFWGIYIEELVS